VDAGASSDGAGFGEVSMAEEDKSPLTPLPGEFYFEGPYMVFTEAYHLRRGYCCQSGCRHCPYGFRGDSGDSGAGGVSGARDD